MDTNTVLQALAHQNILRPLMEEWFKGRLAWALSTEILLEYEEIITLRSGRARWQKLAMMLDAVRALRPSTLLHTQPSYRFHLITDDADDDKFADCAIVAGADYLITADKHFEMMKGQGYKPPRRRRTGQVVAG